MAVRINALPLLKWVTYSNQITSPTSRLSRILADLFQTGLIRLKQLLAEVIANTESVLYWWTNLQFHSVTLEDTSHVSFHTAALMVRHLSSHLLYLNYTAQLRLGKCLIPTLQSTLPWLGLWLVTPTPVQPGTLKIKQWITRERKNGTVANTHKAKKNQTSGDDHQAKDKRSKDV